ncbi:Ig-like domain-containing protein [uncultured Methanobrevibacter sp.]|uniref:Ig-like domain-containing protein n=1 Tax=uncultured Methanobrevibacter sp. TaxID=253161 RepID=UPI002601E470|nr:Ig-like domain-containing protein [uncultured Methanobrevibacter sp.]
MFNRKYFILIFFVFLIAITSVSAQDDVVASQDLNELSVNDEVVDTNINVEQYADGAIKQDTDKTDEDLIDLSECSSAVLQVSDNEGVICVRRDATNAADIHIESGNWGDISYLKQYKTADGYFSHAIITSNGWLIGNGGVTDGSAFRQIESIASEMVTNNQITNDYLSRIHKIISRYSLGHFVIKAADGTYGVVFTNLYHVGKLQAGQYVLCPNVYSMSQKGSYDNNLNPVDAGIKKVYTDDYGVNRRNIMTYHWKLTNSPNGLSYSVDSYASNDDGKGVGRSTSYMADNVYYFNNFHSKNSLPLARDKLFLGNHVFGNSIEVFKLLTPVSSCLVGDTIELKYQVNYIAHSNPLVQFALPEGFDFNSATVSKGNYRLDPTRIVVWNLNDCDVNNYITLSLKAVKSGQFDFYHSLDNTFVGSDKLFANNYGAILSVNDVDKYYKGPERLNIYLKDANNNPIVGENVIININGVDYKRTSDEKGIASLAINLSPGEYLAKISYNGRFGSDSKEANINISKTIIGNDIVKMFRNATKFYAKFIDTSGNPLANQAVTFNINGVFYTRNTNESGYAGLNINLRPGTYILTGYNPVNGEQEGFNITIKALICENHDIVKYYKNDTQYTAKVYNKDGSLAIGKNVTFNINGVFYSKTVDENGTVKLNINLNPGEYIITALYEEYDVGNNVVVKTVLLTDDLSMEFQDGSRFNATVLDGQGNPLANQTVIFNINGVFYNKTTADDGVASLNINLLKGKYIITSTWNNYQIGNKITIS